VIKELRSADPESVGPYRLLGRLGVGGMGQVYLARSRGGRLVAIKLIKPELAEEPGFRARFASEIAAARNVGGMYTAAVIDADSDAELPWMATVYVPGPSLAAAVHDDGPLPVGSVLALAAGLAEALGAIHRAGVVHRDLKPSNVLLAADGPRVIDFGISRAIDRSMLTTTGVVMGSPGFMSPEQAMGWRGVGKPTDVFSLGAVLTFAATGVGPFGGGPYPALLYRVVNEEPNLAQVPAQLCPLIKRCLAKDPADRPVPADILRTLSGEASVLTGKWLPKALVDTLGHYRPAIEPPTSAPAPPVSEPETGVTPGPAVPVPPTPLPVPGTGGPTLPPATAARPLREWRWPVSAGAAVLVVAVVATILAVSPGGVPNPAPGKSPSNGSSTPRPSASHSTGTTATAASASTSGTAASSSATTTGNSGGTAEPVTGCLSADLQVAAGAIQGSAGAENQVIVFTNLGSTPCTLYGYPGVALAAGTPLAQVGAAADRSSTSSPQEVTLPSGGQASALLRIVQALIYTPSKCQPTATTDLQIYPPNQTTALYLPYQATGCALASAHLLTIDVVKPGNQPAA
jgi:serine/threonine protein kinase